MLSDEGLVVDVPENSYKDATCAILDVCNEEGATRKGIRSKDMLGDRCLPSFRNFVSFSKPLGLHMGAFEKEVAYLLRKMEAKKGHSVRALSMKRRPLLTCHFDKELWKLESLVNYNQST